jgi:2-phosphoglycolate phosphatase
MKRDVELIMFDLDGTLAATGRDLADAVNTVRFRLELEPLDDRLVYSHVGRGVEYLLRHSLPPAYQDKFEEVMDIFLKHYEEHLLDTTVLYPSVEETLERFSGKKKAVVTNKRQYLASAVLRGLGIEACFDAVIGGDCGMNKKPDPSCIRHLLDRFKIAPDKAVIVGDGDTDIEAGRRADVHTCAVTYGLGDKEQLAAAEPDFMIDDLKELTQYIR